MALYKVLPMSPVYLLPISPVQTAKSAFVSLNSGPKFVIVKTIAIHIGLNLVSLHTCIQHNIINNVAPLCCISVRIFVERDNERHRRIAEVL